MERTKVGIQLHPQATSVTELLDAARASDAMGVDSIWLWDHFYPLYGDPEAAHFECYSVLAAMSQCTSNATLGALVTCNSYRNPQLLADMSRTIDHLSGGRFVLGIGSGWFERDYDEYGYEFGTAGERLAALGRDLPVLKARLGALTPGPIGQLPILIGGSGEKVTLRLVAEFAQAWNSFGPPESFAHKNQVLDSWCEKLSVDPHSIERTVAINANEIDRLEDFREAGADHVILMVGSPFDLADLERLVAVAHSG